VNKVALVIHCKPDGAGLSAIYRALMFADELRRHADDVAIVFDGAGSTAAAALLDPTHAQHRLFERVRESVRGVCRFCAQSYGVLERIEGALPLLAEDRGHASLRQLLIEERQILTY
jgi:hypothetical protein